MTCKSFLVSALALVAMNDAALAQVFDVDFSKPQASFDGTQGYDFGTVALTEKTSDGQMSYSVAVPDGNYRVTVTLGAKKKAANTTVFAESRRLLVDNVDTKKGEFKTMSWTVHKRSPRINATDTVRYKAREKNYINWDAKLTLTFCGKAPAVSKIHIEPDTTATTIFLCGNSTVVDQEFEPWASWGQMIPRWFDDNICIANYAESGERTTSFMASRRLDKALSMAKAGDYFIIEFGHNDEKDRGPGTGAWYNFTSNVKRMVDLVQAKGCTPILVTPTARRFYDKGKLKDTHGDYPEAIRTIAKREGLTVIELTEMTTNLYLAYGEAGSTHFLVHYPANTYPGQDKALADNTHFNTFGAYEVSKCIVMGLKKGNVEALVKHLNSDWADFDSSHPDDWQKFDVPAIKKFEIVKPDGN